MVVTEGYMLSKHMEEALFPYTLTLDCIFSTPTQCNLRSHTPALF